MLSLVIQAGGESRRMGQEKALLPFLGQPLIQRVVQRLRPLADEILVTTNHPQAYAFLNLPLVSDLIPGRGALGGLYTALSAASQPLVAVVACDMPFASLPILTALRDLLLTGNGDIAIPGTTAGLEPFHAIYRRETCLPYVAAALQAGLWRADAWFNLVKVSILSAEDINRYDPLGLCFRNINTPRELIEAEGLARWLEN
jgi:molybdopterin-guanine dinucleotide biosynthesis protein A